MLGGLCLEVSGLSLTGNIVSLVKDMTTYPVLNLLYILYCKFILYLLYAEGPLDMTTYPVLNLLYPVCAKAMKNI